MLEKSYVMPGEFFHVRFLCGISTYLKLHVMIYLNVWRRMSYLLIYIEGA